MADAEKYIGLGVEKCFDEKFIELVRNAQRGLLASLNR